MKVLCCLALAGLLLVPDLAFADCGKIIIIRPRPGRKRPKKPKRPKDPGEKEPGKGNGKLPKIGDADTFSVKGVESGEFWEEDKQEGVISWNGKEQVLVLTTQEKSLIGKGAMLSVMPLPGKPVGKKVSEADAETFTKAKKLIKKLKVVSLASAPEVEVKIGAHNIFVFGIFDPEDRDANITPEMLTSRVQAYIDEKYDGKGEVLFTKRMIAVLTKYMKAGFHYFAFDLMQETDEFARKVAIRYHFECPGVYYPLVISQLGGSGETEIDLVVFSPGGLTVSPNGLPASKLEFVKGEGGKKVATVSRKELAGIDPTMAKLFSDEDTIYGRNLIIKGKLNGFKADLRLRGAKK